MKRKYKRRPDSDTKLKSHQVAYAHVFEVVTSLWQPARSPSEHFQRSKLKSLQPTDYVSGQRLFKVLGMI